MKIGRNAPCPCGSGKKYKKCCLNKKVTPPESLHYRRLSRALDNLMPKLIKHGTKVFGEMAPEVAMGEFLGWPDPDEDTIPDEEFFDRIDPLFWLWFVFNWEYDRFDDLGQLLDGPENKTIAELYLESRRIDPKSPEGQLLYAVSRWPYSFLEIKSVAIGESVRVKDVLTGAETTVQEKLGSEQMQPGDIVFGRAAMVGGLGMFIGMSAFLIPPRIKPDLITLRRNLSGGRRWLSNNDLYDWDIDLRAFFFSIDRSLHTLPDMRNTHGEPLEFHKLVYDIDSPETAVEKLAALSVTETLDDIRAAAERDADGKITRASFDWGCHGNPANKGWTNTVLGKLDISAHRITVTVNSAERAAKVRKEVEDRLGGATRFRLDEINDLEAMMAQGGEAPPTGSDLNDLPEMRQYVENMLREHWEGWVDMEIPALGNKTPKQAARSDHGREAVEALLLDAERIFREDPDRHEFERELIAEIRRSLKLDEPPRKKPGTPTPEKRAERVARVKQRLSEFGNIRLHDNFTRFALKLCDAIADSNHLYLHRGRVEIWAAAIMYAIAQLNFLFSKETPHHLTPGELCGWFDVKQQTAANKASKIREALNLFHNDERFCAAHITQMFKYVERDDGFLVQAEALAVEAGEPVEPLALKPPIEGKTENINKLPKTDSQNRDEGPRQPSLFD